MKLAPLTSYRIAVFNKDGGVIKEMALYGESLALQQYQIFLREPQYRAYQVVLIDPYGKVQQSRFTEQQYNNKGQLQ